VPDVRTRSSSGQSSFQPFAAGLPASTPRVAAASGPAGTLGLIARSSTGPVAIGARWQFAAGVGIESAASIGVPPAHRVIGVIGPPANAAQTRLLLADPDQEAAVVDVALLTEKGLERPPGLTGIHLDSGSTTA